MIEIPVRFQGIRCSFMQFQVDCNQQLGDIYNGTMELVEVSHCLSSNTRLLLNLNSVSSSGSATRGKVLKPFTRTYDPELTAMRCNDRFSGLDLTDQIGLGAIRG